MKRSIVLAALIAWPAAAHEPGELGLPMLAPTPQTGTPVAAAPRTQPPGQTLPMKPARRIAFETSEVSWASVSVSPDGKTIAFDILGDLYVMPMSGGRAKPIARGMAFETQPVFSPDGKWLAFVSDRSGSENLWVMRPDGSGARQISFRDDDTPLTSPAWSADGGALYVSRFRPDLNGYELWRHGLSGAEEIVVKVRGGPDQDRAEFTSAIGASLSREGRFLYYAGLTGSISFDDVPSWTIRRRDLASGAETVILPEPANRRGDPAGAFFRPVVSPDGQWLAYATRRDGKTALHLRHLETGADRMLAYPVQHDQAQASPWQDIVPGYAFTPDGAALVAGADGRIERIDTATGARTPIAFTARVDAELGASRRPAIRQDTGPVRARLIQTPELSPDGRVLAFSAFGHVYVMPIDGSAKPRRLTSAADPEFHPSWSPDGRSLTYVSWTAKGGGHVWTAPADASTAPRRLTDEVAFYTNPVFTPDGGTVLALRSPQAARLLTYMEFGNQRAATLVAMPAAGGTARDVLTDTMGGKPHFANGQVHLQFGDGLNAVDLATGKRRKALSIVGPGYYFIEGPVPADDVRISRDATRAIVIIAQQLHLVDLGGGDTIDLSNPGPNHRQLSDVGADFMEWADGGRMITWSVGSTYYRMPLGAEQPMATEVVVEVPRYTPHGRLLLSGARVITMNGDQVIEDADILIDGDKIAAVGARGTFPVPSDVAVRGVRGKTIVPGFIDTHDHVADVRRDVLDMEPWGPAARLAYGITTAFDPSTLTVDGLAYEDLVDAGLVVGSRLPSTGPALFSFNRFSSLGDVRAVLRRYRDHYRTFNLKEYRAGNRRVRQWIAMAAQELGMLATTEGALSLKLEISQIIDGYGGSEHAFPVTPLGRDIAELVARSGSGYTTTLQISNGGPPAQDWFVTHVNQHDDPKYRRFTPHFAADAKMRGRKWRINSDYNFTAVAAGAAAIQRAGGRVGVGAHGELPGIGYHWEMEAHVMGGMTPTEVLRAATIGGAEVIGRSVEFGSIEAGKYADLVILDADPRADIRNTRLIAEVMKNGRLYDAQTLDELWPRQRTHAAPWFHADADLRIRSSGCLASDVMARWAAERTVEHRRECTRAFVADIVGDVGDRIARSEQ